MKTPGKREERIRNGNDFNHNHQRAHHVSLGRSVQVTNGEYLGCDHHRLKNKQVDASRYAFRRRQQQQREKDEHRRRTNHAAGGQIDDPHNYLFKITVNTMARTESPKAIPRNSGAAYMRSLATVLSKKASAAATKPSFTRYNPIEITIAAQPWLAAIPHGKNSPISSAIIRFSLMAWVSSIKARLGPEYSSTIASCSIVSSRWVEGLSTGMRPVSAITTMIKAENASTWTADISKKFWVAVQATIGPRLVNFAMTATAISDSSKGNSASTETMASRLAPMPPKLLPPSHAASSTRTRAN